MTQKFNYKHSNTSEKKISLIGCTHNLNERSPAKYVKMRIYRVVPKRNTTIEKIHYVDSTVHFKGFII